MSKLIVEMEMPQACRWNEDGTTKRCPIAEWGGACAVTKLFEPSFDNRPPWCPIKGVLPDEHGDLVDADTVLWEVPDSEGIVPPMPVTIGDVIEGYDVPIVIAAERKDDGTTAD